MRAKILARFGRVDEARPLFDRILAADPENLHVTLDYADAMLATGDLVRARELVEQARGIDGQAPRLVRLDGRLCMRERDYEHAALVLHDAIERFGPDAGTAAELGRAQELAGRPHRAREAYGMAASLQPANDDLADALARMEDRVARAIHAGAAFRKTGDDTSVHTWLAGSTIVADGPWRVGASAAWHRYDGPATNGADVETDLAFLDLAATWSFARRHRLGAGAQLFPGANGNTPVSVWAGVHLSGEEAVVERARARLVERAVRRSRGGGGPRRPLDRRGDRGGHAGRQVVLGGRGRALREPQPGHRRKPPARHAVSSRPRRLAGASSRARRASERRTSSTARLMPGVVGARLPTVQQDAGRNALSAWINASTYQLLGDAELPAFIPIGKRFDYVTLAARYDRHVADHWGFMVEGYVGRELQERDSVYGLAAGVGWRPKKSFELAFVGRVWKRARPVERRGFLHGAAGPDLALVTWARSGRRNPSTRRRPSSACPSRVRRLRRRKAPRSRSRASTTRPRAPTATTRPAPRPTAPSRSAPPPTGKPGSPMTSSRPARTSRPDLSTQTRLTPPRVTRPGSWRTVRRRRRPSRRPRPPSKATPTRRRAPPPRESSSTATRRAPRSAIRATPTGRRRRRRTCTRRRPARSTTAPPSSSTTTNRRRATSTRRRRRASRASRRFISRCPPPRSSTPTSSAARRRTRTTPASRRRARAGARASRRTSGSPGGTSPRRSTRDRCGRA